MQRWSDVEDFLRDEAAADLRQDGEVRPCLAAFAGEERLFVAFLRSFAKGAYADAIIELLALAAPLDANRLALSLAGRAWSLHDPIPPVLDGAGDLRQRVLCTTVADGAGARVETRGRVQPFTVARGTVRWAEPITSDGGEGWIPGALRLAVERRSALAAPKSKIRGQARRCVELGHLLALGDGVARDLGLHVRPPVR